MTINPDSQGVFPITDASRPPSTAFGSRALSTVHRNCVICDDQFTIESRVMWREESQRYAHREHFEEPIPEPPGERKFVKASFDPEDTQL